MNLFLIQNVSTGRYFLLPGQGTTSRKEEAHAYSQDEVSSLKNTHLARVLGKGVTRKVPVYAQGPALADQQEAHDA